MAVVNISIAHLTVLDADPVTLVEAAAAGGFQSIGLRIVPPMPTDKIVPVVGDETLIRAMEAKLDETGVRILDIEAVWLMPETDVAGLEPALALGARLGASHLLVVGHDPDPDRLRENFGKLCDLAARYSITIALEMMSYVELHSLAQANALLKDVGRKNVSLLIDALHFYRSGAKPEDLAAIDPGLFHYIHLCDAKLAHSGTEGLRTEGRGGRFYPGEGELPLASLMNALPDNIPVAIEAPCARYAGLAPVERARICGAATRGFLNGLRGPGAVAPFSN